MRAITAAFLGLTFIILPSCSPRATSLHLTRIAAPSDGARVHYYLGKASADTSLEKVLVYVEGTYRGPVSRSFGAGAEASQFGYAIAYPERSYTDEPTQFARHDSRDQRLSELASVIDDLVRRGTRRLVILAQSEGSMLAPELVVRYASQVKGMVCISCGLSVFRDDLLWLSLHSTTYRGHPFYKYDQLLLRFAQMRADPDNTDFFFWGHSFRYWNSYLDYDPIVHLRQAKCPLLYLNGTVDEFNADLQRSLATELRNEGVDIELALHPGQDHEWSRGKAELLRDILDWAKRKKL